MNKLAPANIAESRRPRLALRFISGKYQGGEFPLLERQEIVIGRSSDLDMVLVEEMVSRRHARILLEEGVINIEDLGSTNGTFVNGEKIQKGVLKEGDRILIGTSILKVVPATEAAGREGLEAVAARAARYRTGRPPEEAPRMSGNLEEIPLPDLLQLFGSSRKSGVLVIRNDGRTGRIFLNEGLIRYSVIDSQEDLGPLKSVYRLLEWPRGFFELEPPDPREFEQPLDLSAQEVLMEGFRQLDELNQLKERLPGMETRLALALPLNPPLRSLEPDELDMVQAALNSPNLEAFFERSKLTDLETAKRLETLIRRGYLVPAG